MPENTNVYILNEELLLKLMGENVANLPEAVLLDTARRLCVRGLLYGIDVNGVERPVFIEDDRSAAISLHGEDPTGNIVGLLTDAQQLLRNRPYEPYRGELNGLCGAAWATIATAPANLEWRCWVTFGIAAGGADAGIGLRVRTDGANDRTYFYNLPLYFNAVGPKVGPITLSDADFMQAIRIGGANVEYHVEYEEYRGDTA